MRKSALIALVTFVPLLNPTGSASKKHIDLEVDGTVLRYSQELWQLSCGILGPQPQILVVRVNRIRRGREPARYLRAINWICGQDPEIDPKFFDATFSLQLNAMRPKSKSEIAACADVSQTIPFDWGDEKTGKTTKHETIPKFRWSKGAEKLQLPPLKHMPCYVLVDGLPKS